MANHAYVYGGNIPSNEEVDAVVREVVDKKFPMLQVDFHPDKAWQEVKGYWLIHRKAEQEPIYDAIEFWRSKHRPCPELYGENTDEWEDSDWSAWESSQGEVDCLEFRHGHGSHIWWWLEYEIREELACRFDCVQEDDGVEGVTKNCTERYDTYADYFRAIHHDWGWIKAKTLWVLEVKCFERMENDMKPLIGVMKKWRA